MDITIVIISYNSFDLVVNYIKNLSKKIPIIVIENSRDKKLKGYLEKKYKNTKVLIPEKNLGYGAGLNLGIRESKTKFVYCSTVDVVLNDNNFFLLDKYKNKLKNFGILAGTYINEKIYKNYEIKESKIINKNLSKLGIKEVDIVFGSGFMLNKKILKERKIFKLFDENIFLYFEDIDACLRLKKNNLKLFVCNKIKFQNKDRKIVNLDYDLKYKLSKNWHYCWSKFYFYKKNYSYTFALKKISPNFITAIKSLIFNLLKINSSGILISIAQISGILNSLMLKSSSYRIENKS
jgi:N-acetylglucosaminyl-diphospho-decaprenol L-rhamnosyltransferase